MAARVTGWLLTLMLLISGALADDDYIMDEEAEEEVVSQHVPQFTSTPQSLRAQPGDTVTLPCLMDMVGGVIIWQKKMENSQVDVLFTSKIKYSVDPRFELQDSGVKGNSLVIRGVKPEDSGMYECRVASSTVVSLNHTVTVQYAPKVTTVPASGVLVVKQGSAAKLECHAKGGPAPTVTWTRKGGKLPDGSQKKVAEVLEMKSVDRSHMGIYMCTVDNGIGDPVVKDFRLEVNSAPEIEVTTKRVHSGEGYEAQLVCMVHGQPVPEVRWSRMGGATIDPQRHVRQHEGAVYSLSIDKVVDSDLGVYVCRASSAMGSADATIELTGVPSEVVMTSSPNGQNKDTYTLQWQVESYAPVEEYRIMYKNLTMNMSDPEVLREQAIEVAVPAGENDSVMYRYEYVLRRLKPAQLYQAVVTAKNKYGWSREPAEPFRLATLGERADGSPEDLKGGEVLGSTSAGSTAWPRTALMAAAACLAALLCCL